MQHNNEQSGLEQGGLGDMEFAFSEKSIRMDFIRYGSIVKLKPYIFYKWLIG